MAVLFLLLGLGFLVLGAEVLIRNASALAAALRMSPLVVGLTVVAYGTSAPELTVSLQAAWTGQSDLALGNVVGSNILNVLLILGLSALILPLVVSRRLVRIDVPLVIGLSVLVLLLALDGKIGRLDGVLLSLGLVIYTVWAIALSRREGAPEPHAEPITPRKPAGAGEIVLRCVLVLVGLGLLVLGSRWFSGAAAGIAREFGVSELVIGLSIVAAGTSLPEIATSVLAALRGQRDIAVGNVVGSNLFNLMGVLGLSGALSPTGVAVADAALSLDIPVMIAVAVACLPIFFTGHVIARWEGGVFFGYYIAYTTYLILAATSSAGTRTFGVILLGFVTPLTGITLAVGVFRALRASRASSTRHTGPAPPPPAPGS